MINYDIHWNPVRLMQRIGRVDRRMNPEIEERLVADHPEVAVVARQGELLELPAAGRAERDPHALHQGHAEDPAHLEDPRHRGQEAAHARGRLRGAQGVQPRLRGHEDRRRGHAPRIPGAAAGATPSSRRASSGCPARSSAAASARRRALRGVFFCYALPALDKETGEFTEEAGTTRWYLYDLDRDAILEEPGEIVASIRSKPETPRTCTTEEKTLVEIRGKVEKHIKNTYLKRVDAPVGVKPALKCWMELNEG